VCSRTTRQRPINNPLRIWPTIEFSKKRSARQIRVMCLMAVSRSSIRVCSGSGYGSCHCIQLNGWTMPSPPILAFRRKTLYSSGLGVAAIASNSAISCSQRCSGVSISGLFIARFNNPPWIFSTQPLCEGVHYTIFRKSGSEETKPFKLRVCDF